MGALLLGPQASSPACDPLRTCRRHSRRGRLRSQQDGAQFIWGVTKGDQRMSL